MRSRGRSSLRSCYDVPVTARVSELSEHIAAAEAPAFPRVRPGFVARTTAIEALELHVLDRLQRLGPSERLPPELQALRARAQALVVRYEASNVRFAQRVRERIRTNRYTAAGLRRALARYAGDAPDEYDLLDLLVASLLDAGAIGEESAALEPEMVAYQPTPARVILALLERAPIRPGEVVFDLGSGLGHVAILSSLLGGARAIGIEREPAFCEYARRSAQLLNVRDVTFVNADARAADLSSGDVYFMYTPFRGGLLRQVLARLELEARARPIRLGTFGPCTAEVAATTTWLEPRDASAGPHTLALFDSRC